MGVPGMLTPVATGTAVIVLGLILYGTRYVWVKKTTEPCDRCGNTFTPLRKGKDKHCYRCVKKLERQERERLLAAAQAEQ